MMNKLRQTRKQELPRKKLKPKLMKKQGSQKRKLQMLRPKSKLELRRRKLRMPRLKSKLE